MSQEPSSAEVANEMVEKENAFAEALEDQQRIEQAILLLQRDILGLQHKKKELDISNSQAKHILKKFSIELRLLKHKFWSCKNQGL